MKHRISHKKINGHKLFRNIQYIRQVYLQQSIGGTISAIPMSGYDGTDVNLSNTADIGYSFDSYNITGANLTGNTFKFNKSDVTASPNWTHNVYNLTLETDNNGKLESNKNTGYYNDTATLTATPSSNYQFSGYTVTGGSINNNIFTWSDSNATVKAWFKQTIDPYNPLGLPPYTIRLKFWSNITPTFPKGTGVQVSEMPNVWDLTYENNDWSKLYYDGTLRHQTYIEEVLGANSTNVTSMNSLFYFCTSLTSVALFDTSTVLDLGGMFSDCSALTSVPLFNTSKVTNMAGMFGDCKKLKTVPLFNTNKVTNPQAMFYGCSSLTTVPLFDTSNWDNMYTTFAGCISLSSVPLFNTNKVTNMNWAFSQCTSLTSIPLFNTNKVSRMQSTFDGCTNVQNGALALYQQASTQTNPPGYHSEAFKNCGINTQTGSAELAQIPASWK